MKLSQVDLKGLKFNYRSDDKYIGQRIALGKYEIIESALFVANINNNSIVVDIGANIGYYALLASKIAKKVYAFEPDSEIFMILKKNIVDNNLTNVIAINKAVGDKKDTGYMIKDKDNFGNQRLDTGGRIKDKSNEVEVIKLDDYIKEKIDLIKIDVQGYEPKVVEGAKKIIEKYKPAIFMECSYKNDAMVKWLMNNYRTVWSINDFASVPWPIYKGVVIKGDYCDLVMKNKVTYSDVLSVIKNINYKKWIKGIMRG